MKEAYTFDDVLIVPKFLTEEISRKDVDLSINHSRFPLLKFPVISANMDTVTGSEMATAMGRYGGIGCLHRFCTIEDNVAMFNGTVYKLERPRIESRPFVSIGLGKDELERAEDLFLWGARTIVIDVAHGSQILVVKQAKELRKMFGENITIIAGNFATGESVKTFLEYSGDVVDAFKVGVGPGSVCSTRVKTGVGYPQLSAILDVVNTLKNTNIAVIADGGMKTSGDVAKALAAGAHAVMIGSMFAGTDETPGEKLYEVYDSLKGCDTIVSESDLNQGPPRYKIKSGPFKKYRGSASKESYEAQGKVGTHRTAEGESFTVPCKGPVSAVLQDIEGGLRSSMTYVGAKTLDEFRKKAEFVRVSPSTVKENGAHFKS